MTPQARWEEGMRGSDLKNAVGALPPGQQKAVESLAVRQLSLSEAADATGKSAGVVKVNLHRALRSLRGRFGGVK